MQDKKAVFYTQEEQEKISAFVMENMGTEEGDYAVMHELESEYVHTDILAVTAPDGTRKYVTCGMGARETASPFEQFRRIELLMHASEEIKEKDAPSSVKEFIIGGELCRLSRFVFENSTWFGPGHTINATEAFREAFGYSAFLFVEYTRSVRIAPDRTVAFLLAVPVYEEERRWMMDRENGSQLFVNAYYEEFEEDETGVFMADVPRMPILPKTMDDVKQDPPVELPYVEIEDEILMRYIPDTSGKVIIPEGVKTVAMNALSWEDLPQHVVDYLHMEGIEASSVTIPADVEEIEGSAFWCDSCSLQEIRLDPGNPFFILEDGALYTKDKTVLICCPPGRSGNVREFRVPDGVQLIEDRAFAWCGFESIRLPETLRVIGNEAFADCEFLKRINIPDSVICVGEFPFGVEGLPESVEFSDRCRALRKDQVGILSRDGTILYRMFPNESGEYAVPEGVERIDRHAFSEIGNMTAVTIPEGVYDILPYTFGHMKMLKKVRMPDSLLLISDWAFVGCTALEEVDLADGVKYIGDNAFDGCESLGMILPARAKKKTSGMT